MQRPRAAILLAGCAILLILAAGVSFFSIVEWPFWLTRSNWITLHVYHGRLRVFWIRSYGEPIDVVSYHNPVQLRISPRAPGDEPADSRGDFPMPPLRRGDIPIRLGAAWEVSDFGFNQSQEFNVGFGGDRSTRLSYVRVPIWLIAGFLLLIPLRAAIFGPFLYRRRVRRNRCGHCGYDLTGLPERRCPECGKAYESIA